jgi:hypothetical protein
MMGAFVAMIISGAVLIAVGAFGLSQKEGKDARAVRAFFKDYTSDHHVSYVGPNSDGEWVAYARSLTNKNEAYTVIPVSLLVRLSDETNQVTPWRNIVVDPVKDVGK